MYYEADLVRIAKRENNSKRSYLVVNRLQGKHIPVEPGQALSMFRALADELQKSYGTQRLLTIGFAETATAIGAAVAVSLDTYYIQTTRETITGVEYLYFSEEHSHATEQKLVKDDLDKVIPNIDRIVFVEDEVTTGKTILNIIDLLEKEYPGQVSYTVASILNGMDAGALEVYQKRKIELCYLVKTDHAPYSDVVQRYTKEGEYISIAEDQQYTEEEKYISIAKDQQCAEKDNEDSFIENRQHIKKAQDVPRMIELRDAKEVPGTVKYIEISGWMNARRLVYAASYEQACKQLWLEIDRRLHDELCGSVLVLGTEEFMYPALLAAEQVARDASEVRFHATTRSPIAVFRESQYPLHVRYELRSLYDKDRWTFVYDIGAYDTVLIITDAPNKQREGICSLIRAVAGKNQKIYVIRWC